MRVSGCLSGGGHACQWVFVRRWACVGACGWCVSAVLAVFRAVVVVAVAGCAMWCGAYRVWCNACGAGHVGRVIVAD